MMDKPKAKKPRKLTQKERVAGQPDAVMVCFKCALRMFSEEELIALRNGKKPYAEVGK